MFRLPLALLCLTIAVSSCQRGRNVAPGEEAQLLFKPDTFVSESGESIEGERAILHVPENYNNPQGRTIELAVARFRSTREQPAPPIVYLAGGPGGAGIYPERFPLLQALRAYGDVITFDQRGTGASRPSLDCPESVSLPDNELATREAMLDVYRQQARECATHWQVQGVDLSNFTTEASAADVDLLRRALGVPQIRLLSFSYGSHLALAIIRRYEAHIERAVLAGVEGPNHTIKLPINIERHLNKVSQLIAADTEAGAVLPDFAGLVTNVVSRLEQQPVPIQVTDDQGEASTILLTSFDIQRVAAGMIGRRFSIEAIPAVFGPTKNGDFSRFSMVYPALRRVSVSAMQAAMDCASGVSEERWERILAQGSSSVLGVSVDFPYPEICKEWGVPQLGTAFREAVQSSVPTLFLSGGLDGRTPVSNTEEVLQGFPNSAHVIVERMGHEGPGIFLGSPRVMEVIGEFMEGKMPETTSIYAPPLEFRLP